MKNKKYIISEACISCSKCSENCPKDAISFNDDLFRFEISQEKCIACGLCYRGCVYKSIALEEDRA